MFVVKNHCFYRHKTCPGALPIMFLFLHLLHFTFCFPLSVFWYIYLRQVLSTLSALFQYSRFPSLTHYSTFPSLTIHIHLHACVCVVLCSVHVHLCVCECIYVQVTCVNTRGWCWVSFSVALICIFRGWVPYWIWSSVIPLIKVASLPQRSLSLTPEHWDYSWVATSAQLFYVGSGAETLILICVWGKPFVHWVIFTVFLRQFKNTNGFLFSITHFVFFLTTMGHNDHGVLPVPYRNTP